MQKSREPVAADEKKDDQQVQAAQQLHPYLVNDQYCLLRESEIKKIQN